MIIFFGVLVCLSILGVVYAFSTTVASVGNQLLGGCEPAQSSRQDIKQQEIQELLEQAEELERQVLQLQRDTSNWRRSPTDSESN